MVETSLSYVKADGEACLLSENKIALFADKAGLLSMDEDISSMVEVSLLSNDVNALSMVEAGFSLSK